MVCDMLGLLYRIWCWCRCPEIATSSIDWTQLSRFFYLNTETESSLRNVVFLNENRTMDNVQKHYVFMSGSFLPSNKVPNLCFPCRVEVKNAWSFTYVLTLHIHGVVRTYRDQCYPCRHVYGRWVPRNLIVIVAMGRKCVWPWDITQLWRCLKGFSCWTCRVSI
jgi:hypothetical protein